MNKTKLSSVVARQLPEFIREDHSKFVSFLEAYYEFLQSQQIDFNTVKDIDLTLDKFLIQFKKELAYNLPYIVEDERFFLQRIKDQYLSKGSEASFKLLFKLLFNKDVQISYPGKQMLRASDGRWNQEVSIFIKVNFGDPEDIVGKILEIQSLNKTLRVQVDKKQEISGEVERIVNLGENVYELFIDRRFYGKISPGNILKLGNTFQATILPVASIVKISKPGSGFRVGQVFEIKNTTGTGTLIKIIRVDENSGIKHAQIIKFGIGYLADFSTSLLPTSSITNLQNAQSTASSYSLNVIDQGENVTPNPLGNPAAEARNEDFFPNIIDPSIKFDEFGFISKADYVTSEWVDPSWCGTVIREFSTDSKNAATENQDPAIIEIYLDALARYPGYFETNDGFLSDSIFIQDSRYYQAFSYVTRISERLDKYSSAVKTMLHPAGMMLFGEYEITDNFDLGLELESLIKSLAISFSEIPIELSDSKVFHFYKIPDPDSVTMTEPIVNNHNDLEIPVTVINSVIGKAVTTDSDPLVDTLVYTMEKQLTEVVVPTDFLDAVSPGYVLDDSTATIQETFSSEFQKTVRDSALPFEPVLIIALNNDTYFILLNDLLSSPTEDGYVVVNGYEEGGYFSEVYANARNATFSS
jgi:hypothetical protein